MGELRREEVEEEVVFGRCLDLAGGGHLDEARITADLAQLHEGVEDRDPGSGQATLRDRVPNLGVGGDTDTLIEVSLGAQEFDGADDLGFFRELWDDLSFRATQDEGRDARSQSAEPVFVAVILDGLSVALDKRRPIAEEAWHQKIEEGPELAEVIFEGRPREAEAVVALEGFDGPMDLAPVVLDHLGFVEDDDVKGLVS